MKRVLGIILSGVLVFAMAFSAYASVDGAKNQDDSFQLGDLISLFSGASDETDKGGTDSMLEDALSGLLDSLKESLPEIIDSVQEIIPQVASSLEEVLPELESAFSDEADLIAEEGTQDFEDIINEINGLISSGSMIDADDNNSSSIAGIAGSDDLNVKDSDKASGIAGLIEAEEEVSEGSLSDLISAISAIAEPEDEDTAMDVQAPGRWSVNADADIVLTKEEADIFQQAESTLAGGAYTPVAVVATQIVAGTNYAYLCLGTSDEDTAAWYIITLYQDLSGDVTTLNIDELELDDLDTMSSAYNPAFVGSWTANEEEPDARLPEDAQAAFDKAMADYVGVDYSPIALLGTQLVSGKNYRFLCYGTLVTREPVTSWYVVDISEDLQGNCMISNAQLLDLTEYIDYGGIEANDAIDD